MLSVNICQAPKSLSVNIKKLVKFKYSSIPAERTLERGQSYTSVRSWIQINIVRKKIFPCFVCCGFTFLLQVGNGSCAAVTGTSAFPRTKGGCCLEDPRLGVCLGTC